MSKAFAISDIETDTSYLAIAVKGLPSGSAQQWSNDPEEALCFARKKDAEGFAKKYLANMVYRVKEITIG